MKQNNNKQQKNRQIVNLPLPFSYRSGDEKKDKAGEKSPENNSEPETPGKNPKLVQLEINRGTAV